jgi:DNA-binding transcriptional ArsR family regulator
MRRGGSGQELVDTLLKKLEEADPVARTNGHAAPVQPAQAASLPTDDEVIEKCRGAKNAAKFSDLFDHGDAGVHHGGDDSVADLGLLGMLTHWTQDKDQLERIFSASALGQRDKWRRRDDYRDRTIAKALSQVGDTYEWDAGRSRPLAKPQGGPVARSYIGQATGPPSGAPTNDKNQGGPAAHSYIGRATGPPTGSPAEVPGLSLVRFADRPAPAGREFMIPDLIPRGHATTLYGWGGTAKSLIAMLLAMSVAGNRDKFLGRDIAVHGPVLYIDFELDADEQHRRVMQLAAGTGTPVPDDLMYVSTLGFRTHDAVEFAYDKCDDAHAVMVVLDSLGPAMVGDMSAAKDVIEFHNHYIAPFKAIGSTPILVDHQARQQAGEGYQTKGAFGSAYKEHLSRSLIQVERGDQSAEAGTLNIRLRHKKTNFGALLDPFDVELKFSDEAIEAGVRELTPGDMAQEITLNSKDRVKAALEDGPAYPDELVETTGLPRSTVKNAVTALKKAGIVEITGEVENQKERVRLVAQVARPINGRAAGPPVGSPTGQESLPDTTTVIGLFANPPDWLSRQLKKYREDPELHIEPLCAAVAATLQDRGSDVGPDDVRAEVEAALAEDDGVIEF